MRNENVPPPSGPDRPPPAPYYPPQPAPQAAAWRRALKVVGRESPSRHNRVADAIVRRVAWR